MSRSKYTADITKGIVLSSGGSFRAFRWPDAIPGLGARALGVFGRCESCPTGIHIAASGTWCTYGGRPVCEACALLLVAEATKGSA